jgi:hypothetical protein
MKFFQSKTWNVVFYVGCLSVVALLFCGLSVTLAQTPANQAPAIRIERPLNPVAAIVNLPAGQQFMYIIPAEEAEKMRMGRPGRGNIYVTYEVKSGEFGLLLTAPRLIRFLQAGDSPGSWSEVLYIQER